MRAAPMNVNGCALCGSPSHLASVHNHLPVAALWFPPFGNPGAQQPSSSVPQAAADNFAEALKAHEDKVAELIGNLSEAERAIAYKYLHASGMRIGCIDDDLRKAIRKEVGKDH